LAFFFFLFAFLGPVGIGTPLIVGGRLGVEVMLLGPVGGVILRGPDGVMLRGPVGGVTGGGVMDGRVG